MDKKECNTGRSGIDRKDTVADDTNKIISPNAKETPRDKNI